HGRSDRARGARADGNYGVTGIHSVPPFLRVGSVPPCAPFPSPLYTPSMHTGLRFLSALVVSVTTAALPAAQGRRPAPASGLRFDVSFIPQVHDGPITGRAFVMITRSIEKEPEPRLQIGRTGVPFFGRDVERLEPEKIVALDGTDLGTPVDSLNDIPPGDYYVQAVVVVYNAFKRP